MAIVRSSGHSALMRLRSSRLAILYVAGVLVIHAMVVWNARDLILKGYPDFTIYYTAGTMIRQGMGHDLYNNVTQFVVQQQFAAQVATRLGALPFNHPPFEALLFVPFAYFPYRVAYLLWTLANLGMLATLPILLRPYVPVLARLPSVAWTLASLAFFPIFFALLQGQDAILLMFLYGLAFVALKNQRLVAAGAWLACGLFKFHLVLPFLFLLLIQQRTFEERKKLLGGFVAVAVLLGAISFATVGMRQMSMYPHYLLGLEATTAGGAVNPFDMPNLRGLLSLIAGDNRHFGIMAISLSAMLVLAAAWIAHRSPDDGDDPKFCLAVFTCVLVSYHALAHDLCVLALPVLLLLGWLSSSMTPTSWTRPTIIAGLAVLLFSPLQLVLLMRYNRLALLAWAVLLCFAGVAGELRLRTLGARSRDLVVEGKSF